MKKPDRSKMTLQEKIGQTGIPSPRALRLGLEEYGGYDTYFEAHPFAGFYVLAPEMADGKPFSAPQQLRQTILEANERLTVPLFVTCDAEDGAKDMFPQLHRISTNMSVGAADSCELAYLRSFYSAKEMRSYGANWCFGPVLDMQNHFLNSMGVRCLADHPEPYLKLIPSMIRGFQDAGIAACAKHFPGEGNDYRDTHFCSSSNEMSMEEWDAAYRKIWKCAIDSGVKSIMIGHASFPAADATEARPGIPRPASASGKVLELLRKELQFDGVLITDAVGMKAMASAFSHEDLYIECFNAGNDIVLFVNNDYIDVMEQAVKDGRISMERLEESVERILRLKEELGLFEEQNSDCTLTEEESHDFSRVNYEVGQKALTLIKNSRNTIPFEARQMKKITIIKLGTHEPFLEDLRTLQEAFAQKGIEVTILKSLESKTALQEIAENSDMILYACYLQFARPNGMPFFTAPEDMGTLMHSLSYGTEKSVVVSFGAPSIYYHYFQNADMYINAYSSDEGTMKALADGLLGGFPFTGKSPVVLKPHR